ncbi:hypothetical protein IAT38_004110 [Cryptococcus sp. DSM 104549]
MLAKPTPDHSFSFCPQHAAHSPKSTPPPKSKSNPGYPDQPRCTALTCLGDVCDNMVGKKNRFCGLHERAVVEGFYRQGIEGDHGDVIGCSEHVLGHLSSEEAKLKISIREDLFFGLVSELIAMVILLKLTTMTGLQKEGNVFEESQTEIFSHHTCRSYPVPRMSSWKKLFSFKISAAASEHPATRGMCDAVKDTCKHCKSVNERGALSGVIQRPDNGGESVRWLVEGLGKAS